MRLKSLIHQINDENAKNEMEVMIIVHKDLQHLIEEQIRTINTIGDCKVTYVNNLNLLDIPLKEIIGKRIAICSTVPATESIKTAKKFNGLAMILSKMNLPEFMEFQIIKERD